MVRACAQVWGGEDMHRTPRLARILPAIFHALAVNKLSLLEALDLCGAHDPDALRSFLTRNLEDLVFRDEWAQFNQLDPKTFTELFESTRNRLAAFLRNPLVRNMLSQTETVIDLGRAMDDGAIILVNLGGLSQESKRLIGTLLVNALFHKALLRVPEKSRPFYLYLDECYYFFNDDISRILTEGRKFGLHAIVAHQNLGQLREAGDAVYTAVMQIENKIVFGGVRPPADAAEITETIFTGSLKPDEPKAHSLRPMVTGYVKEWMASESKSVTKTAGGSTSEGSSQTVRGDDGLSHGASISTTNVASTSSAGGEGRSETNVPVLEWLPADFWNLQEQIDRAMATLVEQPTQTAVVKLFAEAPIQVTTPTVPDALAQDARVARFKHQVFEKTPFAIQSDEAKAATTKRRDALRAAARKHLHRQEPAGEDFFE